MKSKKLQQRKLHRYVYSFDFTGVVIGIIFACLSFGPSLLPRAWFMQAVICGVTFVIGYGIGVFMSYIAKQFNVQVACSTIKNIKKVIFVILAIAYLISMWLGYIWQKDSHTLVGIEAPPSYSMIGITLLAIVFLCGLCVSLERYLDGSVRK